MSMDRLQELQEELEQWKTKCNQAKQQRAAKNMENMDASERLEKAENQVLLLEQDAKRMEKLVKEKQASLEVELVELNIRNDVLRNEISGLQQNLHRSQEAFQKVQTNLQVKGQLPPASINFTKEDVPAGNQSGSDLTDISYTCHIIAGHYVLQDGKALLTFQDQQVAKSTIRRGRHVVDMNGVSVNVNASEPQLQKIVKFEVKINISNKKIQVSNLPLGFPEDTIKDKVELAFYKSAIGGGEVQAVEYDQSNNSACVTYLQSGVARRVLNRSSHRIVLAGDCHDVKVQPCIEIQLDKLQMFSGISRRSVLLTGITHVNETEDDIQDLLQIHFQRTSLGGGEVENIVFSKEDRKRIFFLEDLDEAPTDNPDP